MGIGAAAFTAAFLLAAVQRSDASYWSFTFPAFIIVTAGTDFEFNVVNVSILFSSLRPIISNLLSHYKMYVVSSLSRSQQSIASSIFQTAIKLATAVGLGICAAIFASVSDHPTTTGYYANDPFEPYAALFWFATATSFASLLLVPFLKIKTQGIAPEKKEG